MKNDAIFILVVVLFRGTFRGTTKFFVPSSLHFVVKNALKRKEKTNRKREREKRDANVFSLLSPRKREIDTIYSHETMPYFSLLYIYIYKVCVCVLSVEQQ